MYERYEVRDEEIIRVDGVDTYRVTVINDPDPLNPRTDYDNMGIIISWARRYDLGDHEGDKLRRSLEYDDVDITEIADVEDYLMKHYGVFAVLPVYMYDHSGISLSTTPFGCMWDSGQIGYIVTTGDRYMDWFGSPNETIDMSNIPVFEEQVKKAKEKMRNEIRVYDNYINGECYMYVIEKIVECEECGHREYDLLDVCGGFEDEDDAKRNAMDCVEEYILEG